MLDTRALGENIKNHRKKRGLTQQAFAEAMGVSFQAVSNWERGIAPPDLYNTVAIAEFFGVLVDDLFRMQCENAYLGVDGGGTKTELVLVSEEGYVLKRVLKDGTNPNDIGLTRALEILSAGIDEILMEYPSVKSAFLGIAGAGAGENAKRLKTELSRRYAKIDFTVKNDAYNLFAIDSEADMALISGTGSVAFVRVGDGYERLGGWGHLLEEGGSAYSIGRDALKLALYEEDMKKPYSQLSRILLKKLNTATVWESISATYRGGKPFVASLASAVFEAYLCGDENASRILDENARALASLLNTGVELYGAKAVAVASGGILEHYTDIMSERIARYSDVRLKVSKLPPIYGACKQALIAAECGISEEFYDNFKKTYTGVNV